MKRMICLAALLLSLASWAEGPWKMKLVNDELKVNLVMDLYEESIDVPSMEMFGPMNGYLNGWGVYGVWMLTSFEIKNDKVATFHLSNDLGSETQTVKLTQQNDSTYLFEQIDGSTIKKAVGRKLVKIPSSFTMHLK